METSPLKVLVVLGFLLVTAHPGSSLTCYQCSSRDHREGCANVDSTVPIQPCTEGEVCSKNVKYIIGYDDSKLSGRVYGFRVVRDCVRYDKSLGPNNKCNILSGGDSPSIRCLCNSTDLCNSSQRQVLTDFNKHGKLLLICLIVLRFISNMFAI